VSTDARKQTGSTLSCSNAPFSAGCAANRSTVAWRRFPRSRTKIRDGPSRERETLVGERTRIVNRLKANLARLGIRGFRSNLARAPSQLEAPRTPEGAAIPTNTLAELRRDMDRLQFVKRQIKKIETTRAERLANAPSEQSDAMVRLLVRVVGVGIETADMLVQEVFSREIRDRKALARYAGLTGAPDESGQRRQALSAVGDGARHPFEPGHRPVRQRRRRGGRTAHRGVAFGIVPT
jgi:transposase